MDVFFKKKKNHSLQLITICNKQNKKNSLNIHFIKYSFLFLHIYLFIFKFASEKSP